MSVELAVAWRGMGWAGVSPGDRQVRFWGLPHRRVARIKARLTDFVASRIRCSAFSFTDKDLARYHAQLSRFRPIYAYGYVSMLREFSEYMVSRGLSAPDSLKAVVATAEPLTDFDRREIESAFGVRVYNEYGCGEVGTIAHECEHGSLHINADSLIVETLRSDGSPCKTGESGQIVVTDLHNFAMPVIRYALEDYATCTISKCRCGINLPILESIQGREYDVLINKFGQRFHGEFFLYIFEDLKNSGVPVSGVRVTQTSPDKVDLEIVSSNSESVDRVGDVFRKKLRQSFSDTVQVDVSEVKHIEREASGKMRVIRRRDF
ncbi:hypothetical protein M0534_10720 [Methylonatrum kenyense]|uniref:phenylacetate--CoA ligase family protein n=1 Tax=Methylonatrum kenyense TaxID=455253 RepID=UPI0020C0C7BD|nr:hypothetical protein [Methylonatrum kenyense]MCK8516789.1 hypothetical protein [Methylonatrum kenyense]